MSDQTCIQSSGSATAEATATPEHQTSAIPAPEDAQASRELEPSDTSLESIHTIASTSSTIAEGEVQPCLETQTIQTRSPRQKLSTEPEVARKPAKNLVSSGSAFVTALLPIPFLVFAALACKNRNHVLEDGNQAQWLLTAAKFGPSIFPIVFTIIMAQFMTAIAAWKLERSITVGLLEYLLASRSLGSAFLSLTKLRFFNIWVPLILAVWCLSPAGGQASLRAVSSAVSYVDTPELFFYLDNNNTTPLTTSSSARARHDAAINSIFIAALASPNASKNGSQDMYGNLHVPMLEAITSVPITDAWYDPGEQDTTHAALFGIPFTGVPDGMDSAFTIHTSYVFCNCTVAVQDVGYTWIRNISQTTSTYGMAVFGFRLRDNQPGHQWNDTVARSIGLQSRGNAIPGTEASCNLTTTYLELKVQCSGGPRNCTAVSIRKNPHQPWPTTATALDCIWGRFQEQKGCAYAVFDGFMSAAPENVAGGYAALEQFFLTPDAPFSYDALAPVGSSPPIGAIGDKLFSQRMTQLLNTYLLASSAPYAISGNFTHSIQDGIANSAPSYGIQSTEGQTKKSIPVLRCDVFWIIVLIAVPSLLIAAGISTAILESFRKGPRVLDDFTSSLRYNPYASIEQKNSIEDGIDIARRSRHVKVQLGDVRPHEEEGLVAVATIGDDEGQTVERLRRGRLYV